MEKNHGSHMFHLVSRPGVVGAEEVGEMLKFSRIVFLDGIQPRPPPPLVIRFNIASNETDPRKQRRRGTVDIAHVHN